MKKKWLFIAICFFTAQVRALDPITATIAVMGGLWVIEKGWNIANTSVFSISTTSPIQGKDMLNEVTAREFLWRRQKYLDCKLELEMSGDVKYFGKTEVPAGCKQLADFYAQMCDAATREQLFQEKK